jgi:hypothetical protein
MTLGASFVGNVVRLLRAPEKPLLELIRRRLHERLRGPEVIQERTVGRVDGAVRLRAETVRLDW